MTPYDLALLRGWLQGLDWQILSDLYLDNASIHETRRKVLKLRNQLKRKARLLNLSCNDFPDSPPIHNEKHQKQGIAWITRISQIPSPTPKPEHNLCDWFSTDITRELNKNNIATLNSAFDYFNNKTEMLNRRHLKTLSEFFDHWNEIFPNQQSDKTHESLNIPTTLDRLDLPEILNGATGENRGPLLKCKLSATNDLQALREWLSLWSCGTTTYNAYRKEVERFLLWMIISQGKPFSSASTRDCCLYREFLLSPIPTATWIGGPKPRTHPNWKPFRGPLSSDSIRYAENILSNACNWLISQHWLDYNPFSGLPRHRFSKHIKYQVATKSLTQAEWSTLRKFCKESYSTNKPIAQARMLFILEFAYYTGARLSEIAHARTSDIYRKNNQQDNQYWIRIIGKGQKERHVPIIPRLIESLNQYWRLHNPGSFWHLIDAPLIGGLRKQRQLYSGTWQWHTPNLTSNGLHQIMKRFINSAKQVFPEPERVEKITMHWLRHTHGSHAISNRVPLIVVRDNLGHQNLATTSIYSHEDENKRWEAIKKGFET